MSTASATVYTYICLRNYSFKFQDEVIIYYLLRQLFPFYCLLMPYNIFIADKRHCAEATQHLQILSVKLSLIFALTRTPSSKNNYYPLASITYMIEKMIVDRHTFSKGVWTVFLGQGRGEEEREQVSNTVQYFHLFCGKSMTIKIKKNLGEGNFKKKFWVDITSEGEGGE